MTQLVQGVRIPNPSSPCRRPDNVESDDLCRLDPWWAFVMDMNQLPGEAVVEARLLNASLGDLLVNGRVGGVGLAHHDALGPA